MTMLPKKWDIKGLLKLHFFKGLTPSQIKFIVDNFESYDHFSQADLPSHLNLVVNQGELFRRGIVKPEIEADKQISLVEKSNIQLVSIWDRKYPSFLKEIHQAPCLLFVKGKLRDPNVDTIGIVGTRKCSSYGKIHAERYAEYFSQRNAIVVSGLARGIDTIAHRAAMDNSGNTYAIVASGVDRITPLSTDKLADELIDSGGAVLSMFQCGIAAKTPYFLQRNRIISGISKATLVIESRFKGGALNTARFARDQGREVYALPGNIGNETSEGTNDLIKRGLGIITTSPEGLFEELNFSSPSNLSFEDIPEMYFENEEEQLVYKTLNFEPKHVDELVEITRIDIQQLLVILLNMEFSGFIKQLPGKNYIKAK